jgi:hypothetical protein
LPDPNAITHAVPDPARALAAGSGSVIERMAPPVGDPQLLGQTNPAPLLTGPAAVRARVADRLVPFNDSIAAEQLAAKRAKDWTVTDQDGKRWGVSPGVMHLKNITLGLSRATNGATPPDAIVAPPGRREEMNARRQIWNEIQLQSTRGEITITLDDRVKQIRMRKDSVRRSLMTEQSTVKKKSRTR